MNAMARTYHRVNWTTSHRPHGHLVGNFDGNPPRSSRPLGSPLHPRAADRPGTTRPHNSGSELSAFTHGGSQGADVSGPGSRSAFTEALTGKIGVSWIRAAGPDVNRLFDEALDTTLAD